MQNKMRKDIRGILFDKDGTLFAFDETWADWSVAFLTALAPKDARLRVAMADMIGFDWGAKTFREGSLAVNAAVDEQCRLLATVHPTMDAKAIEAVAFNALQETTAKPVCDLDQLFSDLCDRGFLLGIATNDFEDSAHQQISAAGVAQHFNFICGYDSGYGAKPAPGMILGFCAKFGLEPAHIAMVGDSTHDLEAGRAAGVGLTIGVLTGPARRADIAHLADVILPDISGLPGILLV